MIFIAADHRGLKLKEKIKAWLADWGEACRDMGADSYQPTDDFPDYAFLVAEAVVENKALGILICSNGVGMTIAANKVKGVRAGVGLNTAHVEQSRQHNQINVLVLAADYTTQAEIKTMIRAFLKTNPNPNPKYQRRIDKISNYEGGSHA